MISLLSQAVPALERGYDWGLVSRFFQGWYISRKERLATSSASLLGDPRSTSKQEGQLWGSVKVVLKVWAKGFVLCWVLSSSAISGPLCLGNRERRWKAQIRFVLRKKQLFFVRFMGLFWGMSRCLWHLLWPNQFSHPCNNNVASTTLSWLGVAWPTLRELGTGKIQLLKVIIELLVETTAEVWLGSSSDDACYEFNRALW